MLNNFDSVIKCILENMKTNIIDVIIISGLHGDEPTGNLAAKYFKNLSNVEVHTNLNPSSKRRLDGKDLNRHFDRDDAGDIQNNLLRTIELYNPKLVISLHEDDEVNGVYAYCSPEIEDRVASALQTSTIDIASSAHGDYAEKGVIVNGKQPYRGTLERALKKRNIMFCTIETPSKHNNIKERVLVMKNIVQKLLSKLI